MPRFNYQDMYNGKCDEMRKLHSECADELATQETHVDEWKRQLDYANKRLDEKCRDNRALNFTLSVRNTEKNDAIEKTRVMQAALDEVKDHRRGLLVEARESQEELSGLRADLTSIKVKLAERNREFASEQKWRIELANEARELKAKLTTAIAKTEELDARLEALPRSYPVPTSGEILRMYTESARDPKCTGTQHLWEAHQMAIARERVKGRVEDFMGKDGAEKLAEQVAELVKGKLTEKERLTDQAINATGRDREQRFRELNDWNRRNPAPVQPSGPHFELSYLEKPLKTSSKNLSPGDIFLDRFEQLCCFALPTAEADCLWYTRGGGTPRIGTQMTEDVTVIGQLKAVYSTKESK